MDKVSSEDQKQLLFLVAATYVESSTFGPILNLTTRGKVLDFEIDMALRYFRNVQHAFQRGRGSEPAKTSGIEELNPRRRFCDLVKVPPG